jgi:hypothetical protein
VENVTGEKPMKKIGQLWRKLIGSSKQRPELPDQSENGPPAVSVAEKVRSYIYSSDYEDGAWLK